MELVQSKHSSNDNCRRSWRNWALVAYFCREGPKQLDPDMTFSILYLLRGGPHCVATYLII